MLLHHPAPNVLGDTGMKCCTRCKEYKDTSEFGRKLLAPDGLNWWCKECQREYNSSSLERRKSSQISKRREKKGAHSIYCMRSKYKKLGLPIPEKYMLPEKPKKTREQARQEHNERNRKWKIANAEVDKARRKAYRQSDKGRRTSIRGTEKRRNLSAGVECKFTDADFDLLYSHQEGKCACCGIEFSSKVVCCRDHIVPLSKGGAFVLDNVQLLCRSCNSKKHDKAILYRKPLSLAKEF
jgi:5-methylcytosine-specific restriction endonuclease McrA